MTSHAIDADSKALMMEAMEKQDFLYPLIMRQQLIDALYDHSPDGSVDSLHPLANGIVAVVGWFEVQKQQGNPGGVCACCNKPVPFDKERIGGFIVLQFHYPKYEDHLPKSLTVPVCTECVDTNNDLELQSKFGKQMFGPDYVMVNEPTDKVADPITWEEPEKPKEEGSNVFNIEDAVRKLL